MLEIPVLETARLVLRGHKIGDFEDAAAMWADPLVTRHIGGRAFSREESWARLLRYLGHWQLLGYGFWAVIEKASGRFVGEVGFADFKRDFDAPQDLELTGNHPEIGWALASQAIQPVENVRRQDRAFDADAGVDHAPASGSST